VPHHFPGINMLYANDLVIDKIIIDAAYRHFS
jgi:hypothetical protein